MSSTLSCGCLLCARLLADTEWRMQAADATQEDLLCDPCRAGICAGAMRYGPLESIKVIEP